MKIGGLLLIAWLVVLLSPVCADEGGMNVGTSVKVNRAKRHQMMEDKGVTDSEGEAAGTTKDGNVDPCAGVEIGTVHMERGKVPKEVTVIVTGDVINVPSRKCK